MDTLVTGGLGSSLDADWPEQLDFSREDDARRGCGKQGGAPLIGRASDLQAMHFDPVSYVVPGYVVEGCTILAGRPKLGKSWLCLEMALAVASGTACLGNRTCKRGSVLLIALEDNQRRLHRRLKKVCPGGDWPDGLNYATQWPRADEGGIAHIERWISTTPDARLVIIDVLAMFRTTRGRHERLYDGDYAAVSELQCLASKHGVAIVVVHHVRKSPAENDPFEKVSGTQGLTGAADTVLVLDRDANGVTLYGRGRDVEEIEAALAFDKQNCRWHILGDADAVHRSDARKRVLDVLAEAEDAMTPVEIALATGSTDDATRKLLHMMMKDGEVGKQGRGRYLHPDKSGSPHDEG